MEETKETIELMVGAGGSLDPLETVAGGAAPLIPASYISTLVLIFVAVVAQGSVSLGVCVYVPSPEQTHSR